MLKVSCHLMGGLGNQMFQVASTSAYGWENNKEPVFAHTADTGGALRKKSYTDSVLRNLNRQNLDGQWAIYRERGYPFQQLPVTDTHNLYFDGYFQSFKYFDKYKDRIQKLFEPSEEHLQYIKKYNFEKSVSVHVRRGDYLNLSEIHYNQPMSYYEKALQQVKGERYYIFSDDLDWCKNQSLFNTLPNVIFIDEEDYISYYMMTMCSQHIIANSSFSWWGAYLSNSEKVVCPTVWFGKKGPFFKMEDIALPGWTLV